MSLSDDIPAAPSPVEYSPDQIVLYGIQLNDGRNGASAVLPFDKKSLFLTVEKSNTPMKNDEISVAVVYGYGFEGHCYRFDKPKLLIFEHSLPDPAVGCGFDGKNYKMWRITSKRPVLEISTDVGAAEDLILEANLPGRRAPNTYGNDMQLAHRGGRLGRTGGST